MGEKKKIHLLMIGYPTEVRARSALKSFLSAYLPETGKGGCVRTEDGSWTGADQYRRFVIVVFGAASEIMAQEWLQASLAKLKENRP
jgi:hypothetical protein